MDWVWWGGGGVGVEREEQKKSPKFFVTKKKDTVKMLNREENCTHYLLENPKNTIMYISREGRRRGERR